MGTKKNFVIDTNVILHDYNCLKNFQENDIYLPIVVLEELDKFKKGNEQINFNAREFLRELDLVTDDNLFNKGASVCEHEPFPLVPPTWMLWKFRCGCPKCSSSASVFSKPSLYAELPTC